MRKLVTPGQTASLGGVVRARGRLRDLAGASLLAAASLIWIAAGVAQGREGICTTSMPG
jgi:hypothetical protein